MIIDFYSILPLIGALFILFFGVFVLSKNLNSRMYQLLFGFCMSMFFWMLGTSLMFATRRDPYIAVFWDRFVYFGVVFMPPLMHHFSLIFTGRRGEQKKMLGFNYLIAFFFLFASVTPYFVDDLYYYWWGVHSQARILHTVFLGYFFLGTGLFFVNLWRYFRQLKEKAERARTIYVFLAFAIVIFVGGSAYLFAYNIDTKFPFAYLTGIIFPVMLFYNVTRHHALGIRVVLTEVFVGITNALVILQIFLAKSPLEILVRALFAVLIVIISVLLIISINKETRRREEIQKLASELKVANEKLIELDKAKSEFLSIAAHQLRTPLTIVKGYISMIQEGDYGPCHNPKIGQILANVYQSNEHLIHLVNDFLDVARIEAGKIDYNFQSVDLGRVLKEIIKDNSGRLKEKGLKLKIVIAKDMPLVKADEEKIHHVIFNLFSNAIKYTEKGFIEAKLFKAEGQIVFEIIDSGIGLSRSDRENIFQKFYRSDNAKQVSASGVGLGLFVCRKFIEAHKGEMFAKSAGAGKGSAFGFKLPLT